MAGLLDMMDDPMTAGAMGLLNASGFSRTPVSMGQALASGYGAYQQQQDRLEQKRKAALTEQMQQMQLADLKQKQADAQALRDFDFGKFYKTPQQQALEAHGGPTVDAANAVGTFAPKFDQKAMLGAMMASRNPALMQQAMQALTKESQPIKLGKDEQLLDPSSYKPLASNITQEIKNGYIVSDGKGGWKIDPKLYEAERALKTAGATNVSVNTGNAFGKQAAEAIAGQLTGRVDAANSIGDQVNAANQILEALDSGKVIAGPGTSWKIAANQVFGSNPEKLTATRQAIQGLAKLVMAGRQSFKGQGAISDTEQRLATNALSGDIDNMSVGEIKLLAEGAIANANYIHQQGSRASGILTTMPGMEALKGAYGVQPLPRTYQSKSKTVFDQADAILKGQ